ncbi:hypothetical protein N9586_01215 [Candidatus Pelagibacter sp.]|nr:hypothetical protein [Candidatus Pelagibacter sp.]
MNKTYSRRKVAQLILLQRIELAGPKLAKIRKLFGRYFFTNFVAKYFIKPNFIITEYLRLMRLEMEMLEKYVNFANKKILSVGCGMGGLEIEINKKFNSTNFDIIEKDYISKKVKYGWDDKNIEAYNSLSLLNLFLESNGISKDSFNIYNSDLQNTPIKKYDLIISLFSLDYHYNFNIYHEYFKKISNNNTFIIFDTIRANYFEKIFKHVSVIQSDEKTTHKSKRIICNGFIS